MRRRSHVQGSPENEMAERPSSATYASRLHTTDHPRGLCKQPAAAASDPHLPETQPRIEPSSVGHFSRSAFQTRTCSGLLPGQRRLVDTNRRRRNRRGLSHRSRRNQEPRAHFAGRQLRLGDLSLALGYTIPRSPDERTVLISFQESGFQGYIWSFRRWGRPQ